MLRGGCAKMSRFSKAIKKVLEHEGYYSEHPNDPGGATKYGISLRFLKQLGIEEADVDNDGLITFKDIQALTKDRAIRFYKLNFWDRYNYDELPPQIGEKAFDISVNMGPKKAHICLQRAVRAISGLHLKEDGIVGPKTKAAIQGAPSQCLLAAFKSEVAGHYRFLAKRNTQLDVFLKGWLNRAYD